MKTVQEAIDAHRQAEAEQLAATKARREGFKPYLVNQFEAATLVWLGELYEDMIVGPIEVIVEVKGAFDLKQRVRFNLYDDDAAQVTFPGLLHMTWHEITGGFIVPSERTAFLRAMGKSIALPWEATRGLEGNAAITGLPLQPADVARFLTEVAEEFQKEQMREKLSEQRAQESRAWELVRALELADSLPALDAALDRAVLAFPDHEAEARRKRDVQAIRIQEREKQQKLDQAKTQEFERLEGLFAEAWKKAEGSFVYRITYGVVVEDGLAVVTGEFYTPLDVADEFGYFQAYVMGVATRRIKPANPIAVEEIPVTPERLANAYDCKRSHTLRSELFPDVECDGYLPPLFTHSAK